LSLVIEHHPCRAAEGAFSAVVEKFPVPASQSSGSNPTTTAVPVLYAEPRQHKAYLDKTYPEAVAKAKAKAHRARIYFLDEAAFRSDAHRGSTWGKRGETPVIKNSGGRFGFRLISAVSARGDMRFDVIDGSMDAEKFIGFLR
jgi:hypothetical protein